MRRKGDIIDDAGEMFTMDDAGNRSNINLEDESDVNYVVEHLRNVGQAFHK